MVDGHETLDEFMKRLTIFRDEASKPKMIIIHSAREQDSSELLQAVRHGLPPLFDEVPAQGRTSEDENEAEEDDELRAQADESGSGRARGKGRNAWWLWHGPIHFGINKSHQ
jgi:hypothetical protein